ncbi:MAG TPA: hypothetical protein PLO51_06300, partial [Candidatus Micrarchaeota archaeon]|nr:hypothetical protein [Candidatus Micrarchaeota archaeon]
MQSSLVSGIGRRGVFRAALLLAILASSFLFLGCVQGTPGQNNNVDFNLTNINRICADSNQTPCVVFKCQNDTGILGLFPNLHYGNCSFARVNYTSFQKTINNSTDGTYPMLFMVGQGPNLTQFNNANKLCN